MSSQAFVDYVVRWRPGGNTPGAAPGLLRGHGDLARACVPLREHPDPRRLDLRASLRDPFEGLWVRDFHQNTAAPVVVLLDMSASMGFRGARDRYADASELAVTLARSAWRNGDPFGFFAAADAPVPELALPVRVNRSAADWLAAACRSTRPRGASAQGLAALVPHLPARRSLVFLVSDFAWPSPQLPALLGSLARHEVVPVALWDRYEGQVLPRHGLARLRDVETGRLRFVWFRPGLVARIRAAYAARERALVAACARWGLKPCIMQDGFSAEALTRHLLDAAA